MPNLLATGAAFLAGQLKNSAGVAVSYQQGKTTHAGLTATVSDQQYDVLSEDGTNTIVTMREYVFTAADLPVTPRSGDVIRETDRGIACTVAPLGDKPVAEDLDAYGTMKLVRTKKTT